MSWRPGRQDLVYAAAVVGFATLIALGLDHAGESLWARVVLLVGVGCALVDLASAWWSGR